MSLEAVLADLESKVGTETGVGNWKTVTQEMINQFADATGDHQWIHVDPERANAESPYGAPVAHGYLTLSLIPYLVGFVDPETQRYPDLKMGINYGLNRVRFPNPVRVGSKVRARTKLQEYEEVKGGGVQIVDQVYVEIEGQEKPACVAETVTRLYF